MEYSTSEQISKKWKISQRRIIKLAKEGRIEGAKQLGRNWMIPSNAAKPLDNRTKLSKKKQDENNDFFRYPSYAFMDESLFDPPLSKNELTLKKVIELVYSCEFNEADKALGNLPEESENIYCQIYAIYCGCMIDIYLDNIKRFTQRYQKLYSLLSEDFPHKKEMSYLIEELNATLGFDDYFSNQFKLDATYSYDPSFMSHLIVLMSVSLFFHHDSINPIDIKGLELSIKMLEETNDIINLQNSYTYLGNLYSLLNKEEEMRYYYQKSFEIAERYHSYYPIVQQYYFLSNSFDIVLDDYSKELKKKLKELSNLIHIKYLHFTDELSINSIYKLFPSDYYPLLYYGVNGYTSKEIADILHLSENTINKKYTKLYDIANVKNKNELINLYKTTLDISILKKQLIKD